MVNKYYQKKASKSLEKKHMKDIRIFLEKKNKTAKKGLRQISKSS